MKTLSPLHAATTYLRLKPDGRAEQVPLTEQFWPDVMAGKLGDFHHEYLVTSFSFAENWPTWEQHPHGDEIVVLLSGAVEFTLEMPDGEHTVELRNAGEYAFVPRGIWHTASPSQPTSMLFITAGEGTQVRPR